MTSIHSEATPLFEGDHENRWIQRFPEVANDEFEMQRVHNDLHLTIKFNDLWSGIQPVIQDPVLETDVEFGGFSGHRIVTFQNGMGRCALGFYITRNTRLGIKAIVADRRKIYTPDTSRVFYMADELSLTLGDVKGNIKPGTIRRMATLTHWLDKFKVAESYEN